MTRDEAKAMVESMPDGEVLALRAFLDMLDASKAEEDHIVFADGQCPRCGGMPHNYGGPAMRCPDCGWTEQEGVQNG